MCVAAPKGERVSGSSSPRFEALPLTRSRQNHLVVRAFINGKPALLGVDSGAPISAIALKRRAHFGLTGIPGSSTLPARPQSRTPRKKTGKHPSALPSQAKLPRRLLLDKKKNPRHTKSTCTP